MIRENDRYAIEVSFSGSANIDETTFVTDLLKIAGFYSHQTSNEGGLFFKKGPVAGNPVNITLAIQKIAEDHPKLDGVFDYIRMLRIEETMDLHPLFLPQYSVSRKK